MAISRQSANYYSQTIAASTSYTHSAYDPGYGGSERARIILIPFRTLAPGGGAVINVTYGGLPMHAATGHVINNFVSSIFIFYIINPPTGAQDIIFTTIGGTNWSIRYGVLAYESNTDYSFRIGEKASGISSAGVTSFSTLVTPVATASWMVGLTNATQNQTLTDGTYLVGDADPGQFMIVDSNAEVAAGASTGVGCTTGAGTTFLQEVCTIIPIRRGLFWFLT